MVVRPILRKREKLEYDCKTCNLSGVRVTEMR